MLIVKFNIDKTKILHTRQVYTWVALFSDVGGLCGTLAWIVSFIALPYDEYSYIMKQIGSLYYANLKENF